MSFLRKLTAQKPTDISTTERNVYNGICIGGGAVALIGMLIALIATGGSYVSYTWAALLLGLGSAIFYTFAVVRYHITGNVLINRLSDASVYLTVFCAYAPLQLIIVRPALYENGSIVNGWVSFGLVGFFSLLFIIASICSANKFRLFGSFIYILMALSILFGVREIMRGLGFAPVLALIFLIFAILCFVAAPIFFWFFDKKKWQMTAFYACTVGGTLFSTLITVLYVLIGY